MGRLSDIPNLGDFDIASLLQVVKGGVDTYGQVQAIRKGPTPIPQPAPAPGQTVYQPAQPAPRQSNALRYIVGGLAALGVGVILYRAIKRR